MADQTRGRRAAVDLLCSACWGKAKSDRVRFCTACHHVICRKCAEGESGCLFCGHRLGPLPADALQDGAAQGACDRRLHEGRESLRAPSTWSGLTGSLAHLHRRASMEIPFGAFLVIGVGSAVCNGFGNAMVRDGGIIFVIASLLGSAYQMFMFWQVFARRNRHFAWHRRLEFGLSDFVRGQGGRIAALVRSMQEARRREFWSSNAVFAIHVGLAWLGSALFVVGTLGQVLWRWTDEMTILSSAIGVLLWVVAAIIGLYIARRLTEDFYYHEQREDDFLRMLGEELRMLGLEFCVPTRKRPAKKRHFWLYVFVYTPLTMGLFGIYWLYVMFCDPHRHISDQHQWESCLLPLVPRLVVPETVPTDADIAGLGSGLDSAPVSIEEHLERLSELRDKELISADEYEKRRQVWIEKI